MSNPNIPPAIQEEFNQAQQLEEQLKALSKRISHTQSSIIEIESTLKELADVEEDAVVYKNKDLVLIKISKNKLVEDYESELEDLQVRFKNYNRTFTKTQNKYEELRKKIMEKFPKQPQ